MFLLSHFHEIVIITFYHGDRSCHFVIFKNGIARRERSGGLFLFGSDVVTHQKVEESNSTCSRQ